MKAWLNGEFVSWKQVKVPVMSHAFGRGSAIFEVVDIVSTPNGGAFLGLREHVDRFFNSAAYMYMDLPLSKNEIIQACIETAKENNCTLGTMKFFAYYSAIELDIVPRNKHIDVAIFCLDFGQSKYGHKEMSPPADVCISSYRKLHPESVPIHAKAAGNYIGGYVAKMEAKKQGFDDIILLDTMGFVAEAATANVFLIKDNKVLTPTLRSVLPGINRMVVLDILKDMDYTVEETDISPDELFVCDEAFYTSSIAKILPIRSIDGIPLGDECPGEYTQSIFEKVAEVFSGKIERFDHWITPI